MQLEIKSDALFIFYLHYIYSMTIGKQDNETPLVTVRHLKQAIARAPAKYDSSFILD